MTNQLHANLAHLKKIMHYQDLKSINKQEKLVQQIIDKKEEGIQILSDILINRQIKDKKKLLYIDAIIFNALSEIKEDHINKRLNKYFHNGIVNLQSSRGIDYRPLRDLLIAQEFQKADILTQEQLCQLAGLDKNSNRNWLYFTDIAVLSTEDLNTMDTLWRIHSLGKFGFSIQRKIWLSHNRNWDKLWNKIGWKTNSIPRRYPDEFTWNTLAPKGHLPLFNQLRGVQVLSTLFEHPVWEQIEAELN